MPMKLNIGLSRKIGEANYGSRGASVHVELELDSSLVSEPAKLQERIRQLFGLVRNSLQEELNGASNGTSPAAQNGASNGHGNPRPATQSQIRAIKSIATRQKTNLSRLMQDRFRISRLEDLSIRQASQLIDELKGNGHQEGG